MRKKVCSVVLVSLAYLIFPFLGAVGILENESVKQIQQFMGGASAIYFLFLARTNFSKLFTLYAFLLSTFYLFIVQNFHVPDTAIFVVICICFAFFISYFFISEKVSMELYFVFYICWISRLLMSPVQWGIAFLLEILLLYGFLFWESPESYQDRKGVFFSFSILFLLYFLFSLYLNSTGGEMKIGVALVLAAAGAGGVQLIWLSKTERGQTFPLFVYFISTVLLGFHLRTEGETFLKVRIVFLLVFLFSFLVLGLIAQIKDQPLLRVLSESKTMLYGIFLPFLFCLSVNLSKNSGVDLNPWISSFLNHIIGIQVLQFILEKEDEEGEKKEDEEGDLVEKERLVGERISGLKNESSKTKRI